MEAAQKEVDKYKSQVTSILKEAIRQLYRAGRDVSANTQLEYEQKRKELIPLNETENDENLTHIAMDEIIIISSSKSQLSQIETSFYDLEKRYGIFLFAKMLVEEDETELFKGFIAKSKALGQDFIKIINEEKEKETNNQSIVLLLIPELKSSFVKILVKKN